MHYRTITSVNTERAAVRYVLQFVVLVGLLLWGNSALAATLSVSPGTGVYAAGQTFTARVVVNTSGANINAAEGTLSFKPGELSVVSVSKGTIFNLWTAEPSFSNTAGTISFSGGTPTGYTGSNGTVLSVTFRTKGAGSPRVNFANGSVLAADGRGTNVLTGMNGGSFTVTAETSSPTPETVIEYVPPANTPAAPSVTSGTHPDQALWYKEKTARLSWSLPSGVTAVRTLLDERSSSVPTRVYDTPIDSIELSLEEGVQYFHVQFKNADGWGKVTHYRLAVDTLAPTRFELSLPADVDLSNPIQTLVASTADATSKVLKFKVQIDGAEPIEIIDTENTGTITLPSLTPGYHTVVVEAFDEAGNSTIGSLSFTILAFDKPVFTEVPSVISAGVIPVFKGATRPNAEVIVTFSRVGANPIDTSVRSDANGAFTFIPDTALQEGVYDITARAVDQYGAQSEMSDPVRVAVQAPGYLRVGSFLVNVLSVLVPLIALSGLLLVTFVYTVRRTRRMRRGVAREAHEVVTVLEREFGSLATLIAQSSQSLQASRKTGKLTKAEDEFFTELTAALTTAQATIVKEVTDVEDIVD